MADSISKPLSSINLSANTVNSSEGIVYPLDFSLCLIFSNNLGLVISFGSGVTVIVIFCPLKRDLRFFKNLLSKSV